jgi:outer membrane immunogenic protein
LLSCTGDFMKRLLLATVAAVAFIAPGADVRAADMAVKAPPVPYVPPPFNWTGFYVGGNVGVGAVTGTIDDAFFNTHSVGGNADFIGGGQIGYNWQFSPNVVFGFEWFFDGISGNNRSITFVGPITGNLYTASASADWVTTITGRIGFTGPTADHWMFYVLGGGGWLQTEAAIANLTVPASISVTNTNGGWVAGAGVEWAFAQNWTFKAEYQYLGLGNIGSGLPRENLSAVRDVNFQMGTVGVIYLFNWGAPPAPPVVSRY